MTKMLIEKIKTLGLNPDISREQLNKLFENKSLGKNEILLNFNSTCKYYFFVNKGALRTFFIDDGTEYTSWFAFEGYLFTEIESYTTNKFSNYCICAIEESEILMISKSNMEYLFQNHPFWQKFVLLNQEQIILKLVETIKLFQAKSAYDRYRDLFKHPDFIQRTKQKDLSTMIGITRHSLSRIRKKK